MSALYTANAPTQPRQPNGNEEKMARVRIKNKSTNSKEKKIKLLEILCSNHIHTTKVFDATEGYVILPVSEEHAEKLFTKEIKSKLEESGFTPILPPQLRAKKSIIVTRVDELIYDHNEQDIAEEIIKNNGWMGDECI